MQGRESTSRIKLGLDTRIFGDEIFRHYQIKTLEKLFQNTEILSADKFIKNSYINFYKKSTRTFRELHKEVKIQQQ